MSLFVILIFLGITSAISFGLWKGGLSLILSGYALGLIGFIFCGLLCAALIFSVWQNEDINPFSELWALIVTSQGEEELFQTIVLSLTGGFLIPFILLVIANKDRLQQDNKDLGNAHFATALETYKAGFLKQEEGAILIGKKYGVPLWSNGFEHVLVFAPTGSGKTRSIGIPNLLKYPYSVVCNDVKLTMYQTTARYREKVLGQKCFCWAPTDELGNTHRYNPFAMISSDRRQRITDIQRIAHILIPDSKKSDPIWQQAARKPFKAMVMYLLDTPERPTTLGEISRLIKQQGFDDWLASTLEETSHLDPECYRNSYSYLNNHEKTRSSILETLTGYFELFEDPTIDAATSESDFDLRNLRREKMTIYIGFSDDDMDSRLY